MPSCCKDVSDIEQMRRHVRSYFNIFCYIAAVSVTSCLCCRIVVWLTALPSLLTLTLHFDLWPRLSLPVSYGHDSNTCEKLRSKVGWFKSVTEISMFCGLCVCEPYRNDWTEFDWLRCHLGCWLGSDQGTIYYVGCGGQNPPGKGQFVPYHTYIFWPIVSLGGLSGIWLIFSTLFSRRQQYAFFYCQYWKKRLADVPFNCN